MTSHIQQGNESLVASCMMGTDRLRTDVFRGGERVASIAVVDGRAQEYVPLARIDPDRPSKNVYLEYDIAETDRNEGNVTCPAVLVSNDVGCAFGTLTESWLSPGEDATPFKIEAKLARSVFDQGASVDGHDCMVFKVGEPPAGPVAEGGLVVHEVIYIDSATMDVRRWETVQTTSASTVRRVRDYSDIEHATSAEGWGWRIDVKKLMSEDHHGVASAVLGGDALK